MSEPLFEPSSRTAPNRVNRMSERAKYDEETVYQIIDENLDCFVTFKPPVSEDDFDRRADEDEFPLIIPMACGRVDNRVLLHGHINSRLLKALSEPGTRACITFSSIQGIVLARSAFHNSFNYRSAVVFGMASLIIDPAAKLAALAVVTNHAFKNLPSGPANRWADSRPVSDAELKSTRVIEVVIETASAKVAEGGPNDEKKDIEDPSVKDAVWAGKIVRKSVWEVVPGNAQGVTEPVPTYVNDFVKQGHE